MKCPVCGTSYDDSVKFCMRDGAALISQNDMTVAAPMPSLPTTSPVTASEPGPAIITKPTPSVMVGRIIDGRYRLLELLGKGGMGEVYKAEHIKLGRFSAVKLILPEATQDGSTVERFKREAETASKVNHPNAVAIHDFGETEDGRLYLAMEFLQGEPLSDIQKREIVLPLDRTVAIAKQVGQALHAAHQLGVVHRDLKPDNIMVCTGDVVKVVDFGIAKSMLVDERHRHLTQTGFIIGTPQYMSPEQILSENVDARSDIYSLALVVYEMLTGRGPFEGDSAQSQMVNRLATPPLPMRQARPGAKITAAVETVVMRSLAAEKSARHASAADFVADLEHAWRTGTQDIPQVKTERTLVGQTVGVPPTAPPGFGQSPPAPQPPFPPQPTQPPRFQPVQPPPMPPSQGRPMPPNPGMVNPGMMGTGPRVPNQPFPNQPGMMPPTVAGFAPGQGGPPPLPYPQPMNPPAQKKSSMPLILGILAALLIIGGGGAGLLYLMLVKPDGGTVTTNNSTTGPNTPPTDPTEAKRKTEEEIRAFVLKSRDFRENEKYTSALGEVEKALALDPDSPAALIEKAEIYWEQGKVTDAETIVNRVIREAPDFAPAHQNLGVIYSRKGKRSQAIAEQKRTLELNPEQEYVCYARTVLANLYLEDYAADQSRTKRLDEAEAEAKAALQAVTRKSLETSPRTTLANVYIARQQYPEAREHLLAIINSGAARKQEKASAHYLLGATYLAEGSYDLAASEFAEAAKLDPNAKAYQEALEKLQNQQQ